MQPTRPLIEHGVVELKHLNNETVTDEPEIKYEDSPAFPNVNQQPLNDFVLEDVSDDNVVSREGTVQDGSPDMSANVLPSIGMPRRKVAFIDH